MNHQEFVQLALKTESRPRHMALTLAERDAVLSILRAVVALGGALDIFKKYMFYRKPVTNDDGTVQYVTGKPLNVPGVQNSLAEVTRHTTSAARSMLEIRDGVFNTATTILSLTPQQLRIAHGIIGKSTEGTELVEALLKMIETGVIDIVNVGEEMADDDWYDAVIYDATGLSEDRLRAAVIKKLQDKETGRYKTAEFSADAAVNRDVTAERAILEANVA